MSKICILSVRTLHTVWFQSVNSCNNIILEEKYIPQGSPQSVLAGLGAALYFDVIILILKNNNFPLIF